jgi:branched-chain amino acid transport system ATP-binding protein
MLLSARNVSRSFASLVALADASLDVASGEIIGLIGPNGAGKSTFFNCLAGDVESTSGRVMFAGHDITTAPPETRARLGIGRTFQVPATFADMSVLDNVMIGAFLRHPGRAAAREAAREALAFTGLEPLAAAPAGSLGTPGRKRLEIARVLATEPKLLLLDEALAGLNPAEIRDAIALVRRIHGRGITIIIVEHIMEVILNLAGRVLVLNQGRTIAAGKPYDVVREPAVIEAYLGRRHARGLRVT